MNAPRFSLSVAERSIERLFGSERDDIVDCGGVLGAARELGNERVLGSEQEERAAEERVRTRGEHGDRAVGRLAGFVAQREVDLGADAPADPVRLHRLHAVGPARQLVEVVEQLLRVLGDLEEVLLELALLHDALAAPARAVARTCSLASTVLQSGHQLTGELLRSTSPRSQNLMKIHWPQR